MSYRAPEPLASADVIRRATSSFYSSSEYEATKAEIGARASAIVAGVAASAATLPDAPPRITWGERVSERLVLDDGKVLEVPARRGWGGDCAFIDWVNFTVREESFEWSEECGQAVTDDQVIVQCSLVMQQIFGFGITAARDKGANFYKRSYVLGDNFGLVCHGGQRRTVLVSLSGTGCMAAKDGWEGRLHDWLNGEAVQPRITRVDLAHDVYDGAAYSVHGALFDFRNGLFTCGGRSPDCEQRGNWQQPNGKGRSFYVGHRTNGKFCRVYEKGKQLGSSESPWVRVEVEFKNVDRDIPFDVLLRAGEYLSASYPAFAWVTEKAERIATKKMAAQFSYSKMLEWLKHQCGAALYAASMIEGDLNTLFDKIARVGEVPKRLVIPAHDSVSEFIHNRKREVLPEGVLMDMAFSGV